MTKNTLLAACVYADGRIDAVEVPAEDLPQSIYLAVGVTSSKVIERRFDRDKHDSGLVYREVDN